MSTQKNNSSQYKEVNHKIRTVAADLRVLEKKINTLNLMKTIKTYELENLLNERKDIKESNNLIKTAKKWNQ